MKETKKRSIIKGITYRLMATFATIGAAYALTGETAVSLQIGALDFFVKLTLYFINDRLWQRIRWGVVRRA